MSIFYVRAHKISGLLEECAELLSEKVQKPELIDKKVLEVASQFDRLITGLSSVEFEELMDLKK